MHRSSRWIRRGLALALLVAVVSVRRGYHGDDLLPAIGGDTWPPVPVKDARPA